MAELKPTPLELDPKYDDYDYPTSAPVPANGHPGYLTAQQQAQVHQLRLLLEAEGYTKRLDTLTLVRAGPFSKPHERGVEIWLLTCAAWAASLPACSQVRCGTRQKDVSMASEPKGPERGPNYFAGSSSARSGGKRSTWTRPCQPGTTPRRRRCSSTIRSTTTRLIR